MKTLKLLALFILVNLALTSCSNNTDLSKDLSATGDSIVRLANGTLSAEINNTSLQSVYNATLLALNNNSDKIKTNNIDNNSAEITGTYTVDKGFFNKAGIDNFDIKLLKTKDDTVSLFIKMGKFGDQQTSVNLLANIRSNLGL
ncbi:DUF3568 family protein [Francisella philomiragia]|uniref:DUF3568 family protein n=1 Tax=Francisella philomiragia TaxID=28110 RepID=UPI000B592CFE|nr:DUF3568 family protein [Francisella philomiragia]MBK2095851.1 DUF3568 family protein [Francisella philomiragia]